MMSPFHPKSRPAVPEFIALDVPAWMKGAEVLLVCTNYAVGTRRVLALRPDEAKALHREGRLDGWTPNV